MGQRWHTTCLNSLQTCRVSVYPCWVRTAMSVISFPCWRVSPTLLPANSYHGYGLGDHINVENSSITLGCWKDMPYTQQGSGLPSPQDITTVFTNTAEIWMRAITLAAFSPSSLCCIFEMHSETFLHIHACIVHIMYMDDWHDAHFLLSGSVNLLNSYWISNNFTFYDKVRFRVVSSGVTAQKSL